MNFEGTTFGGKKAIQEKLMSLGSAATSQAASIAHSIKQMDFSWDHPETTVLPLFPAYWPLTVEILLFAQVLQIAHIGGLVSLQWYVSIYLEVAWNKLYHYSGYYPQARFIAIATIKYTTITYSTTIHHINLSFSESSTSTWYPLQVPISGNGVIPPFRVSLDHTRLVFSSCRRWRWWSLHFSCLGCYDWRDWSNGFREVRLCLVPSGRRWRGAFTFLFWSAMEVRCLHFSCFRCYDWRNGRIGFRGGIFLCFSDDWIDRTSASSSTSWLAYRFEWWSSLRFVLKTYIHEIRHPGSSLFTMSLLRVVARLWCMASHRITPNAYTSAGFDESLSFHDFLRVRVPCTPSYLCSIESTV